MPNSEIFALLDNSKAEKNQPVSQLFSNPEAEISCREKNKVEATLHELDAVRKKGGYLCGYISYESAYCFSEHHHSSLFRQLITPSETPFIHFYAFKNRDWLSSTEVDHFLKSRSSSMASPAIQCLELDRSRQDYVHGVQTIQHYLEQGDSYQINFTMKYHFNYQGDIPKLYHRIRTLQSVEFGALLNFPEFAVLSFSPELFIRKQHDLLEAKPMKGTWKRGGSPKKDNAIIDMMKADPKMLSENLMIVDLIRNDIGRIAKTGTVNTKNLFEIQTFETLHQMVSTVQGNVDPSTSIADILKNLFPCGSITGAPKSRTMEIIQEIEKKQRGIYTGTIGHITPTNDFCFNIPIRTCIVRSDGTAEMGIGSGILHESDPAAEYEECLLKGQFLREINHSFRLLESMLYCAKQNVIKHLDDHLDRLRDSANSLLFPFEKHTIIRQLKLFTNNLTTNHKIRLTLDQKGLLDITAQPLERKIHTSDPLRFVNISQQRTNSHWFLLQHKTTARQLYDQEYKVHQDNGAYDVLFFNERNHLTEASRHNIFIEKDGQFITSPIASGLLSGIARKQFLQENKDQCLERPITPADLMTANRILLTNAVRGIVEVSLSQASNHLLTMLTANQSPWKLEQ